MATINEKIFDYLESLSDVPEGNVHPQNREYPEGYPEVIYHRKQSGYAPTHDCDTIEDAEWMIVVFSDNHEEVVRVAEKIRNDLKAGSGAISFSNLKLHLPGDYEEIPMSESDLPDTEEFAAGIQMRTII